mgnify:CR=1 FL=1
MIKQALAAIVDERRDLTEDEAAESMREISQRLAHYSVAQRIGVPCAGEADRRDASLFFQTFELTGDAMLPQDVVDAH